MQNPDWFINELAHAGDEHLDSDYVQTYDHKAATDPTQELQWLRDQGLNATHTLVDLGAGTGTFALAAAPYCRRVIAVDVSPAMRSALHEKITRQGITNVESIAGGFLSYEHQGDLADFVYSRHALHHLTDFWKVIALERIAAILKPGGVFYLRDLVYSCEPNEIEAVLDTWLSNAAATPDKGWTRGELVTHITTEHSPFSWLLEAMLERIGFDIRQVEHAATRVHSTYTCIKQ